MPWRTALYGVHPSRQKIILSNLFFIFAGLWGYGWWADFVPNLAWSQIGLSTSISLSVVFTTMCYFAIFNGESSFKPGTPIAAKIFVIFLIPIIFFGIFYISITHGIADIATRTLGNQRTLIVQLSKDHHSSGKSCSYRLEGHSIKNAIPEYLCTSRVAYDSLPKIGFYELHILETPLGFHIRNFNIVRDR
ncbi:hypothetical protein [Stutzerimonas nitrititolerans]|uniref:hypothetical protein n=1 Tax=Stutzerimonas nitrititolerans TaxID=2482751 RepID=UPI0028A054EF|nr:hypothetical protein [Stutzerimonas nitrititolerans]